MLNDGSGEMSMCIWKMGYVFEVEFRVLGYGVGRGDGGVGEGGKGEVFGVVGGVSV